jgi:hypothetical protein
MLKIFIDTGVNSYAAIMLSADVVTDFGIRDKKNIPNTVSGLGILFHKKYP